eukprot:CAMPEP_0169463104 /NCGR_PEP_ID=MMETSP1042-20121227/19921_1 /TAXON_ID=464988 /ORGANISM="Hemiselmis andersenii, Strain CCMP1180" /LENGTH=130 /DNA_ID=CAMNT_0009575797 /DNA_START=218 /DNA_END=608 /DNA_ORIENTATION=+
MPLQRSSHQRMPSLIVFTVRIPPPPAQQVHDPPPVALGGPTHRRPAVPVLDVWVRAFLQQQPAHPLEASIRGAHESSPPTPVGRVHLAPVVQQRLQGLFVPPDAAAMTDVHPSASIELTSAPPRTSSEMQ